MKKIVIIIMLCLLFACSVFVKPKTFTLADYISGGMLHVYTKQAINETSIPLVENFISSSTKGVTASQIVGESMYFNHLEVDNVLKRLKAKVKFTEYIETQRLTVLYAYSKLIPTDIVLNNLKVNLQISYCEDYSVVGWPVIYGSF